MLPNLLSNRAILAGLVFFVLFVGGSSLYSWHVHRTTQAELAETQRKVQPLKNMNELHTAADTVDTSTVNFEHAQTPLETDDAQISDDTGVSPIDETPEVLDMADAFLPDDFVSEEAPAENVPVSPFGFGPYPEVPDDYMQIHGIPIWLTDSNLSASTLKNIEILDRVQIKLWEEGDRAFTGSTIDNGKVYPTYPDVAYIRHEQKGMPDGTIARSTRIKAATPEVADEYRKTGKFPAHIRVFDMDAAGIDPFSFLKIK